MIRRTTFPACALVVSLGVCSTATAQTPPPVTIEVDATAGGTPLERVWSYFGYDETNYTTTSEGEELLRTLTAVNTTPVYTRTHFLFNTGDGTPALKWGSTNLYTEDADGNPTYSFAIIDEIMDVTVAAGAFPLVEIGFMPQALSTEPEPYENSSTYVLDGGAFYPPRDYEKWGELVTRWARHVQERYPDVERRWQWELWNEPDIGYWKGTFEEYAKLYDHTEAALHAVLPDAELGGPAVAIPTGEFLVDFLEHCATGTNAVSGEQGTRLDLVTFHAKGGVDLPGGHVQMDLGNQLRLHRSGFEAVAASKFADRPIVISEADPDGCAACLATVWLEYAYRYSPAYGAYEVATMKRSLELARELGVNLRGVLTWAFTFPDSPYFAGYRALATNGIHLPVLNAFKLLGSLRGDRLPVASSGALPLGDILDTSVRNEPDVDALATVLGDEIQILVWNYHDDLVEAEPSPVTLNVALPADFKTYAIVTQTRVDGTHGNAHAVWESQGSPDPPSAPQLAVLRKAMEPVVLEPEHAVRVDDATVSLSFDLPRFGISLVTLTPSDGNALNVSASNGSACSCRLPSPARAPAPAFVVLSLALLAAARYSRGTKG